VDKDFYGNYKSNHHDILSECKITQKYFIEKFRVQEFSIIVASGNTYNLGSPGAYLDIIPVNYTYKGRHRTTLKSQVYFLNNHNERFNLSYPRTDFACYIGNFVGIGCSAMISLFNNFIYSPVSDITTENTLTLSETELWDYSLSVGCAMFLPLAIFSKKRR